MGIRAEENARGVTNSKEAEPTLLLRGSRQITKGEGDRAVQASIAAMPCRRRGIARRPDTLTEQAVPTVVKAVRWNSP